MVPPQASRHPPRGATQEVKLQGGGLSLTSANAISRGHCGKEQNSRSCVVTGKLDSNLSAKVGTKQVSHYRSSCFSQWGQLHLFWTRPKKWQMLQCCNKGTERKEAGNKPLLWKWAQSFSKALEVREKDLVMRNGTQEMQGNDTKNASRTRPYQMSAILCKKWGIIRERPNLFSEAKLCGPLM